MRLNLRSEFWPVPEARIRAEIEGREEASRMLRCLALHQTRKVTDCSLFGLAVGKEERKLGAGNSGNINFAGRPVILVEPAIPWSPG
jgi:hypothetical protein